VNSQEGFRWNHLSAKSRHLAFSLLHADGRHATGVCLQSINGRPCFRSALNRDKQEKRVVVPAGAIGLKDNVTLKPLLGTGASSRVIQGEATLILPQQTAVAFKAL
jgi:hypothetical protein